MTDTATSCFDCGYQFKACSDLKDLDVPIGDAHPPAGGISLCFRCGAGAIFTGNGLEVRRPSEAETAAIDANAEVQRHRFAMAAVREQHGA